MAAANRLASGVAEMRADQRRDRDALQRALNDDVLREHEQVARNEKARSASWLAVYGPAQGAPTPMAMVREEQAVLLGGGRAAAGDIDSLEAADGSEFDNIWHVQPGADLRL